MKSIHRLIDLVKDWFYILQRDGWQIGMSSVWHEIVSLPYYHAQFILVVCSLTEPFQDLQPKLACEIRPFELADVMFVKKEHRPSEAQACIKRLERGHKGFVALYQGQPIGYAWSSTEIDPELERVKIILQPGDVLCVDSYTAPTFRGYGVQTILSLARMQMFRDLGYRRAIAYIESHNYPSLAVWRKIGGQEIGYIDFIRIGPCRFTRYG